MKKYYNHFENYEWTGMFCNPDSDDKFCGKVTYTPEDGVLINLFCISQLKTKNFDCLYGILSTGDLCTLLGKFCVDGMKMNESAILHNGACSVYAMIFGEHVSNEQLFAGFSLDLTNFQEFCYPQGFKDWARFSEQPLLEIQVNGLNVSIRNTLNFSYLGSAVKNIFHCTNEVVAQRLVDSISEVMQEYPNESISKRTDIGWELVVKADAGMNYSEVSRYISLFENLMSILIFRPVRRAQVYILPLDDTLRSNCLPLLTSFFNMSKRKITALQKEISNYIQPITLGKVENFANVILRWLLMNDQYLLFVTQISCRFDRQHEHELKGLFLINLVQLEATALALGKGTQKEKYSAPFERYDYTRINNVVMSVFELNDRSGIGQALGRLRAEIAHLAATDKTLSKIGTRGLLIVNHCVELIITSHIYTELGVEKGLIESFQESELPQL